MTACSKCGKEHGVIAGCFNIPAIVNKWLATPGALVHPDLVPSGGYTAGRRAFKPGEVTSQTVGHSADWWRGYYDAQRQNANLQGSKPDQETCATYIGGGGQIKIEAQTTASGEQLRRARDFIDLLINSAGR